MLPESPLQRALFRWCALAYVLACAFFVAWFRWEYGQAELWKLGGLAATSFIAMGKLVVFMGLSEGAPPLACIAFMLFAIDMGCAFLLGRGIEPFERLPRVGPALRRARGKAEETLLEYPGLRKLAFFGVVAFVLIPVAGTGAITGSFVARLLGLSRLAGVGAIAVASGFSTLGFTLLARFVGQRAEAFLRNPTLISMGVILALLLTWFGYRRALRELRR